jgi:transposase-like protein
MNVKTTIIAEFKKLSQGDKLDLLYQFSFMVESSKSLYSQTAEEIQDLKLHKQCPHCKSAKFYKRGIRNNNQSFQCRECLKYFSNRTGTAFCYIKKTDKLQEFIECMDNSLTLDQTCSKIGISKQTSFDWRHKVLSGLKSQEVDKLGDVVECDELELPISEKGSQTLTRKARKRGTDFKRNDGGKTNITTIQVVTAIDREGMTCVNAVKSKRITGAQIKKAIGNKLLKNSTLITDEHPSYVKFIKETKGIKHKRVNSKVHVNPEDKTVHVQRVNNYHMQFRGFLKRFKGVSSKYLQNYIYWQSFSKKYKDSKTPATIRFKDLMVDTNAYNLYKDYKKNAVLIRL